MRAPISDDSPELAAPFAYSIPSFARQMGIGVSTTWKYIKAGKIRVVRPGGRTVIPAAEVRRILIDGFEAVPSPYGGTKT